MTKQIYHKFDKWFLSLIENVRGIPDENIKVGLSMAFLAGYSACEEEIKNRKCENCKHWNDGKLGQACGYCFRISNGEYHENWQPKEESK